MNSQTNQIIAVMVVPYINTSQGLNGFSGGKSVFSKKKVNTVTNQPMAIESNLI